RRGADERDGSALDVRKKGVLLCLVEAMNLVREKNRPAAKPSSSFRLVDDLANARHALRDRRERDELPIGVSRDDAGERGLAAAGRSPENHRAHRAALDRLA